jgi:hypothetical protein
MKSIQQMAAQCEGLLGTEDITPWEAEFLGSVIPRVKEGRELTDRQVPVLERIYNKHFA